MIEQATIDRIFAAADVVEVVKEFVSLRKRGVNFLGLCPFHNEKTPSFTVSPSKGIYKCFGCGKGGNAVNFIMDHEQLGYVDALKYLARKYSIEVEERALTPEDLRQRTEVESLMVVTAWAQGHFTATLHRHTEGKSVGLSYFRERGFRDDTIARFQLGYCLDQRGEFTRTALREGYKLEYLTLSGLSIAREGGEPADRFQGRVMFPIHSLSGRVIGFGGRIMGADRKAAKYLNSPESPIFHKGKALYGLYFAKKAITQENKCYLVEGYTDVISLHQAGIENVVASSGTALTPEQIRLIKRFTPNITVLYDGDPAGIKASLRGIDLILEEGLNVRVVLMPPGQDPDSYARAHSAQAVREFIAQHETDFVHFKAQLLLQEAKSDPILRANLIADIVRTIAVIPERITRSVYIKECTRMLDVDEAVLYAEVAALRRRRLEKAMGKPWEAAPAPPSPQTPPVPGFVQEIYCEEQERELVYFLLKFGDRPFYLAPPAEPDGEPTTVSVGQYIIGELLSDDLELQHLRYRKLFHEYCRLLEANAQADPRAFLNHPDREINQLAIDLLVSPHKLSRIWERHQASPADEADELVRSVPKAVMVYKSKVMVMAIRQLHDELRLLTANGNEEQQMALMHRVKALSEIKRELSKALARIVI